MKLHTLTEADHTVSYTLRFTSSLTNNISFLATELSKL